jgi:DNA polymerase-3 subunit delta
MPAAKPVHAIEYLDASGARAAPARVCVLFGTEPFLKRQVIVRLRREVLGKGEGDFSLTTFQGPAAQLSDVFEELSTLAMFGGGKRLVVIEEADDFVSRYRTELEDYVARPKTTGVLVLEVASWPANTRLFKAVLATGLPIECSAPAGSRLTRWLVASAKKDHGVKLAIAVAEQLAEMVGPEMGLLDQELAKLALSTGPEAEITADMVARLVGAWRAKTAWVMLDAALDGKTPQALLQFDRLILAGEHPVAILAQISASLRRLAAATRLVLAAEAAGRRLAPRGALEQAGVKGFVLEKTERQLRRLGRHRGQRLYRWLLEADMDLKGDSPFPPRTILERLLVQISAAPGPVKTT